VTPVRVQQVTPQGRRTTEVVTVVSDGRSVTSASREQTDFTLPALTGPGGATATEPAAVQEAARLVGAAAKTQVLLERPEPPDARLDPTQRPFSTAGTYVLYNASTVLVAQVALSCGTGEQVWSFMGEGSPTAGQVSCAVEPPRSNAVAGAVYRTAC